MTESSKEYMCTNYTFVPLCDVGDHDATKRYSHKEAVRLLAWIHLNDCPSAFIDEKHLYKLISRLLGSAGCGDCNRKAQPLKISIRIILVKWFVPPDRAMPACIAPEP